MLRKEQNDLVTRTVRGLNGSPVPMLLDPGLLAGELSGNDCSPVRMEVLSERMMSYHVASERPFKDVTGNPDNTGGRR